DRGRLPHLGRRRTQPGPSRLWAGLARRVVRRPLLFGGIAVAAMLALGAPALGMRIGSPAIDLPSNLGVVKVLTDIQHEFPGRPAPADIVITGTNLGSRAMATELAALRSQASATGPIRGPVTTSTVAGGEALVVQVPLAGTGSGRTTGTAPQ